MIATAAALKRAGIAGDQVDYVIMGQVIQVGVGQITARQATVKGGIPMTIPAVTVNKVCRSRFNAIALADQLIGYDEFDVVIVDGMESMTPRTESAAESTPRLPLRRGLAGRLDRA